MDPESWNTRYRSTTAVWSPHPNRTLVERCPPAPPGGRSLDLGCGEGADTRWLAGQGWRATGVDFSEVAVERARSRSVGLPEPAPRFAVADATDLQALRSLSEDGLFELVTTSYLHPEPADRVRTFAPLPELLAEGGQLFLLSHHPDQFLAGPSGHRHGGEHEQPPDGPTDDPDFGPSAGRLLTPEQVVAALQPGPQIEIVCAEVIRYTDPTGVVLAVDSLVLARRRFHAEPAR